MSFKDLERGIQLALAEQQAKAQAIADRKLKKKLRTAHNRAVALVRATNAERGGLYRPDVAPAKMRVVLNVRKMLPGGELGELEELAITVPTFSETAAEMEARAQAKAQGYAWRGTVSVEPISK
jgi:hypothetical protein